MAHPPAGEQFMRFFIDRWMDDEAIRGTGDDGQREGGLSLAQEAAYLRLCATQFRQPDGHLPNRRAFLCDAVACPTGAYDEVVQPVLNRFFKKTKDGKRYYNLRTLNEWQHANAKSLQAKEAAELKWKKAKESLSLSNVGPDADAYAGAQASASTDAYPPAGADAACKRERERESEREKENVLPAPPDGGPVDTPPPPLEPVKAKPAEKVVALVKANPWSREACDDWNARFAEGAAPGGKIGKALQPLVKLHGWEAVRPAWRRYLAEKEPEFVSPADFAQKFGHWNGPSRGSPGRPTVAERNERELRHWLSEEEVGNGGR